MSYLEHQIRRGAYADSIVLMQLQGALAKLEGVEDAGVVMATEANLELLAANGLEPASESGGALEVGPEDLLIVVRAATEDDARSALGEVDRLMRRDTSSEVSAFRPKSLRTALASASESRWVLISVPGRYAADVAREAIDAGRHVFLYSDNVATEDEVELKTRAAAKGVLVMGPDCGTATVGGVGLGFANRVRRGPIGIVAASGTGLQAVASRIDALGSGVSHAIGTGGRDLSRKVAGATTLQALELLSRDPETRVIVLVSKPPAPEIAARVLAAARATGKPVVVALSGAVPPLSALDNLYFARSLDRAADLAVTVLGDPGAGKSSAAAGRGFVRGLFSGGTLALETTQALRFFLAPLASNLGVEGVVPSGSESAGHVILDLGADEFTVGRPHPMIDADLRLRRLAQEASDPEVGVILLDLVLGDGAHPDPAGELEPAIRAAGQRSDLAVGVLVIGTESDPQELTEQVAKLESGGATVLRTGEELTAFAVERSAASIEAAAESKAIALEDLDTVSCINVGLEHFHDSLAAQEAQVVHVEWRPPAGGNERLQAILAKMGPRRS
ncbi:MAG: acyl-CoA synthetase FdrA [Thermoanaerobaculia bacterium]